MTQPADEPAQSQSQYFGGAYNVPQERSYDYFPGTSPPAYVSPEAINYAADERPRTCVACGKFLRFTEVRYHVRVCPGQTIGDDAPGRWSGTHPMQKDYRKDGDGPAAGGYNFMY